jgi:glycosyltransferase involved in cell wall biosynthesis
MDKISIIMPVYNGELFIKDCLISIKNQSFTNFEVIMINDFSNDNTEQILNDFERSDSRFKLYNNNNNKGLSKSRNLGLDLAKGDFIFFIDADDIIDENCLKKLYELLKNNNADVAISAFKQFRTNVIKSEQTDDIETFDNKTIMRELAICDKIQNFAWGKLFKKELFKGIRFPDGRVYEDICTIPMVLNNGSKIIFTSEELYFYRQNDNSISKTLNLKKIQDFFLSMEEKGLFYLSEYPDLLSYMCQSFFELFFLLKKNKIDRKQIKNYHALKKIYKKSVKGAPLIQKIKYVLAVL